MTAAIIYYSPSGSDTLNGGGNGTVVNGTNGDIAASTITLNGTFDFTGNAVGDVVWHEGNPGDRHFFTIASFTGGLTTCTALVVDQVATASRTGSNWAVGGARAHPQHDTHDTADMEDDWVFEFEGNVTYTLTEVGTGNYCLQFPIRTGSGGRMIIRAATGATPTLTTADQTSLLEALGSSSYWSIENMILTCTNTWTGARAVDSNSTTYGKIVGCTISAPVGIYQAGGFQGIIRGNDIIGTQSMAVLIRGRANALIIDNNIHGSGGVGLSLDMNSTLGSVTVIGNRCWGNSSYGMTIAPDQNGCGYYIMNNVCYGNGAGGIYIDAAPNSTSKIVIINNILTSNTGYGLSALSSTDVALTLWNDNNAFFSNSSGETNNVTKGANSLTLTADPFTDSAGGDFTLNDVAGGGAVCKGSGFGYSGP